MKNNICFLIAVVIAYSTTAFITDDILDLKKLTQKTVENYFIGLDNIKSAPSNYMEKLTEMTETLFYGSNFLEKANRRVIDYTNDTLSAPIMAQLAIENFATAAQSNRIKSFKQEIQSIDVQKETGENCYKVMCAKVLVIYNGKSKVNYFKVINGHIIRADYTPYIIEQPSTQQILNNTNNALTPAEIRYNAAYYYSHGDYTTAYQKYLEIVKATNDGDANYRLAVMTYHKEGCAHLFNNNRDRMRKVNEFLSAAMKTNDSQVYRNAKNMYENINR